MPTQLADSLVVDTFTVTWRMRLRNGWRTFRVAWSSLSAAPGLFLNVFLGLGGFLLALLSLALQYDNLPPWLNFLADLGFTTLTGLLLVISLALLGISMVTTYWFARPEQFATAAVQGKSTRFILGFISLQIEKLCRDFTRRARRANKLLPAKGEFVGLNDRRAQEIEQQVIRQLTKELEGKHKTLLRLMALKVAAAKSLGVNDRRLCDHVFQFSPVMFDKGTRRYVAAWRLVEAALRNDRKWKQTTPLEDLRGEIVSITESCHRRVQEQIRLRRMEDLHEDIVRFAASLSTSESLLEYAFTLAKAPTSEPRFWRCWPPAWKRRWLRRLRERLRFTHRKQRAHPGYDLHTLLTALCRQDQVGQENELIALQIRLLDAISTDPKELLETHVQKAPELHRALVTLPLVVLGHERKVGAEMAVSLAEHCAGSRPEPPGLHFLVTLGYSRTVLRCIIHVLKVEGADRAFLITDREAEQLSSRLMKSDLRLLGRNEDPNILKSVAAGPSATLLGMIRKQDRVTLLLGAEVFDKDQQVAHPRLLDDELRRFIRSVKGQKKAAVELVVLAARYKGIDQRLAESRFYVDHFDGVSILGVPMVSKILTAP